MAKGSIPNLAPGFLSQVVAARAASARQERELEARERMQPSFWEKVGGAAIGQGIGLLGKRIEEEFPSSKLRREKLGLELDELKIKKEEGDIKLDVLHEAINSENKLEAQRESLKKEEAKMQAAHQLLQRLSDVSAEKGYDVRAIGVRGPVRSAPPAGSMGQQRSEFLSFGYPTERTLIQQRRMEGMMPPPPEVRVPAAAPEGGVGGQRSLMEDDRHYEEILSQASSPVGEPGSPSTYPDGARLRLLAFEKTTDPEVKKNVLYEMTNILSAMMGTAEPLLSAKDAGFESDEAYNKHLNEKMGVASDAYRAERMLVLDAALALKSAEEFHALSGDLDSEREQELDKLVEEFVAKNAVDHGVDMENLVEDAMDLVQAHSLKDLFAMRYASELGLPAGGEQEAAAVDVSPAVRAVAERKVGVPEPVPGAVVPDVTEPAAAQEKIQAAVTAVGKKKETTWQDKFRVVAKHQLKQAKAKEAAARKSAALQFQRDVVDSAHKMAEVVEKANTYYVKGKRYTRTAAKGGAVVDVTSRRLWKQVMDMDHANGGRVDLLVKSMSKQGIKVSGNSKRVGFGGEKVYDHIVKTNAGLGVIITAGQELGLTYAKTRAAALGNLGPKLQLKFFRSLLNNENTPKELISQLNWGVSAASAKLVSEHSNKTEIVLAQEAAADIRLIESNKFKKLSREDKQRHAEDMFRRHEARSIRMLQRETASYVGKEKLKLAHKAFMASWKANIEPHGMFKHPIIVSRTAPADLSTKMIKDAEKALETAVEYDSMGEKVDEGGAKGEPSAGTRGNAVKAGDSHSIRKAIMDHPNKEERDLLLRQVNKEIEKGAKNQAAYIRVYKMYGKSILKINPTTGLKVSK